MQHLQMTYMFRINQSFCKLFQNDWGIANNFNCYTHNYFKPFTKSFCISSFVSWIFYFHYKTMETSRNSFVFLYLLCLPLKRKYPVKICFHVNNKQNVISSVIIIETFLPSSQCIIILLHINFVIV